MALLAVAHAPEAGDRGAAWGWEWRWLSAVYGRSIVWCRSDPGEQAQDSRRKCRGLYGIEIATQQTKLSQDRIGVKLATVA
jgi:hypothetical protein